MVVLSYIVSFILLSFMVFLIVKGIVRFIRNDRGWRRMEEDRKAKGIPFYGEMEEELEKEMYGIDD
jgi:large-conductance mechanosensitive channel